MSEHKKEMSEEEYLRKHLESIDNQQPTKANIDDLSAAKPVIASKTSDLQYFHFDVKQMPCGEYYPSGTNVMVRPALVKEIQSYSMVDDNNFQDIVEKMNDIISSCVRLKFIDGRVGSYLDVKDQDRLYLVFQIRELTFQKGNSLAVTAKCSCNTEVSLEMKRANFVYHEFDKNLEKFFNKETRTFKFKLKNGKEYEMAPPTIGLQKAFTEYIINEHNSKRTPNLAFLKIIPFLLPNRSSITQDGIKSKLDEFEKMDEISFQFLNAAVNKMVFGIKELRMNCPSCGLEVRSEMVFPNGASGIFLVPDALTAYIQD